MPDQPPLNPPQDFGALNFQDLTPEQQFELHKLYYQAALALEKDQQLARSAQALTLSQSQETARQAVRSAHRAHEFSLHKAIQDAYIEVAKGELARRMDRADFVQKAAAAISTAYVGIIALTFGLGEGNTPLPAQGIAPTFFLGLAILFSTVYISYITRPDDERRGEMPPTPTGLLPLHQRQRLNEFIFWTREPGLRRLYFLQAAVISLGIGIIYLPVAYLPPASWLIWLLIGIGLALTLLVPLLIWLLQQVRKQLSERSENRQA